MEKDFFDFAQTKEALSQLSADLAELNAAVAQMSAKINSARDDDKKKIAQYEDKLASMRATAKKACDTIDAISKYIDGVL